MFLPRIYVLPIIHLFQSAKSVVNWVWTGLRGVSQNWDIADGTAYDEIQEPKSDSYKHPKSSRKTLPKYPKTGCEMVINFP